MSTSAGSKRSSGSSSSGKLSVSGELVAAARLATAMARHHVRWFAAICVCAGLVAVLASSSTGSSRSHMMSSRGGGMNMNDNAGFANRIAPRAMAAAAPMAPKMAMAMSEDSMMMAQDAEAAVVHAAAPAEEAARNAAGDTFFAGGAAAGGGQQDGAGQGQGQGQKQARMVQRSVSMMVEHKMPTALSAELVNHTEAAGGYVVSMNTYESGMPYFYEGGKKEDADKDKARYMSVSLSLRVPALKLNDLLTLIGERARVLSETQQGQDVTEQFIDAKAREANLEVTRKKLSALMERANNVQEALAVQRELTFITEQQERQRARMKYLSESSDLALVTLTIQPEYKMPTPPPEPSRITKTFTNALDVLASIGLVLLDVAIYGVVFAVPLLILLVLAYCVVGLVRRARHSEV